MVLLQKQNKETERSAQREEYSPTQAKGRSERPHPSHGGKVLTQIEELVTRADKTFVRRRKMWVHPKVAERINQRRKATDWVRALGNYVPMYFVGDFVRDRYLGKVSKNITVLATSPPGAVKHMLNRLHISFKPSENMRDSFTFIMDDMTIDISSIDADTLVNDLSKKYFTIDAIAQAVTGQFYDPFKGLQDLKDKVLRSPYNRSKQVFDKNPIAILQAAKYIAEYELEPHSSVLKAIPQAKDKLSNVSPKKIGHTFEQIMTTTQPHTAMEFLKEQDLLGYIHPALNKMLDVPQKSKKYNTDLWEHTMDALKAAKSQDLILNLSILLHDVAKPVTATEGNTEFPRHAEKGAEMVTSILSRLQFDDDVVQRVSNMVLYHEFLQNDGLTTTSTDFRKLKLALGEDIDRLVKLGRADCASYSNKDTKHIDRAEEKITKSVSADDGQNLCPLDINEIMDSAMINEGPLTDEIQDFLHNKVLYGDLSYADKNRAGQLARDYVNHLSKSIDEIIYMLGN